MKSVTKKILLSLLGVAAVAAAVIIPRFFMTGHTIAAAKEKIDNGDYRGALDEILTLSDSQIERSDSLSLLLSAAYYGLTLTPTEGIARECVDMDFTPDRKSVVFTDFENGSLSIYSFPEMKMQRSIVLPKKTFSIDLSPSGKTLAAAMGGGTVLLCDFPSGENRRELTGHRNHVRDVVFLSEDSLYSCSNDHNIALWDVSSASPLWGKIYHSQNIKSLQLSADGHLLISGSNDGSSAIIRADGPDAGRRIVALHHGDDYVNDAALSPDGGTAVTVSGDRRAKVWGTGGTLRHELQIEDALTSVDISSDGSRCLAAGKRFIHLIDLAEGKVLAQIPVHRKAVWTVLFLDDDTFAAADNTRFYTGRLLTGPALINAARKLQK